MSRDKWKIGITDYVKPPADIEAEAFGEAKFVFLPDWQSGDDARQAWAEVDAILNWHTPLDSDSVPLLKNCRIAVRYGVGYDNVDVTALARHNIPLCNTPDYGTEEVADAASAMILALQRKIVEYDRKCREYRGKWQEGLLKPHMRTSDCTVGVIGVGRIGTAVVNRMKPFGFKIVGYDPYLPSGHEKAVGYERIHELGELLGRSDIVTLHCPLTHETRGMVDAQFLAGMKEGAAIVNTARGGVFENLDVLENALRSGHLHAAALDVLPDEPPKEHSLLDAWRSDEDWLAGRLTITPHAAYYSERGWYEMRYKAAETARMFLMQGKLRNHIEPGK